MPLTASQRNIPLTTTTPESPPAGAGAPTMNNQGYAYAGSTSSSSGFSAANSGEYIESGRIWVSNL